MPEPLDFKDDFLSVGDCWLTELANALVVPAQGYQWQNLADELGYSYEEKIEELERRQHNLGINPVYELLRTWGRREGSTFRVLQEKLKNLGRLDVSRVLDEAIKGEFCLECKIWLKDGPKDFTIHTNHTSTLAQSLATFLVDHRMKHDDIIFVSPTKSGFILDWSTSASKLRGRELVLTIRDNPKLSRLRRLYKTDEKETSDTSSTSSNDSGTAFKEQPIIHKHYFVFDQCSIGTFNAPTSPRIDMTNNGISPGPNLVPGYEHRDNDLVLPPPLPPKNFEGIDESWKSLPKHEHKVKKESLREQLKLVVPPPIAKRHSSEREGQLSWDGYFNEDNFRSYGRHTPEENDQSSNKSRGSDSDDYVNIGGAGSGTGSVQTDATGYCALRDPNPPDEQFDRVSSASQHFVREISQTLEEMCWDNPAWHPMLPSSLSELGRVTAPYRGQDGWYLIHTYSGQITLTVTFLSAHRHFKLFQDARGKVYFDEDDYKSKTLEDLIEVYKFKDIPVKDKGTPTPPVNVNDLRYTTLRPILPPKGSHIRLKKAIPVDPTIGF